MKKKYVLQILRKIDAAEAIKKDPSYITRMPEEIPEKYRKDLLDECKRRYRQVKGALEKLT